MAGSVTINADIVISRASIQSQIKKVQTAFAAANFKIGNLSAVNSSLASSATSVNQVATATKTATKSVGGLNSAFAATSGTSAKQFNSALGNITGNASEFQKSMDAATARVFAFGATVVVLNTVSQAFLQLVDTTVQVEKALIEINSIFGATRQQFAVFRDEIFAVAKNTGQSFASVAEGAAELARQGLSASETANRLNASLSLSRISGLDAEASVNALTAAINGFTSAGLDAEGIVNKIIAVDTAFAVSAKDLADGFARAGSTAEDAGVSFDELLAIITAVQQRTSRGGAVIGNALKSIFTRISRSTTISSLQELGVEISNTQTGVEKLQALSTALETISDPDKTNKIKELAGGVFQINVVSAALKDLSSETSIFSGALNEAANAGDEMAQRNAELNKSLAAQFNSLVATITDLSEKIGQLTLAPFLSELIKTSESIGNTLNASLGQEAGNNFAKGVFSAIGSFISGPGAALVAAGLIGIFFRIGKFAKESLNELLKINAAAGKTQSLEAGLSTLLEKNKKLRSLITNSSFSQNEAEARLVKAIAEQNIQIQNQNNLRKQSLAIAEKLKLQEFSPQTGFVQKRSFGGRVADRARSFTTGTNKSSASVGIGASILATGGFELFKSLRENSNLAAQQSDNLSKKIARLKEELSNLDEAAEPDKAKKLKDEIESLTKSFDIAEKEAASFSGELDGLQKAFGIAAASLFLFSGPKGPLIAFAIAASAVASEISESIQKIKSESFDASTEGADIGSIEKGFNAIVAPIVNALGGNAITNKEIAEAVNSQVLTTNNLLGKAGGRLLSSSDRLIAVVNSLKEAAQGLTQVINTSGALSNSQLNVRSQSQRTFDESSFFGASSQLLLNKSIADFGDNITKAGDSVQKQILRDLESANLKDGLSNILENIADITQGDLNLRAQELGFASTSEISVGGKENTELLKSIFGTVFESGFGENRSISKEVGAFRAGENLTDSTARAFAEDIVNFFQGRAPTLENTRVLETANQVLKNIQGGEIVNDQARASGLIENLKAIIPNLGQSPQSDIAGIEGINNILKSLEELGVPLDSVSKDLFDQVSKYAEVQRNYVEQQNKLNITNILERQKIEEKFIEDLKSSLDDNITSVQNLRDSDVTKGIDNFSDPFSKGLNEALKTLGIEGTDRTGLLNSLGQGEGGQFSRKAIDSVVSDFINISESIDNSPFTNTIQDFLKSSVANLNIDEAFAGIGGFQGGASLLNPLKQAQSQIAGATNAVDLQNAVANFQTILQNINPRAGFDDDALRSGSLESAQLIKVITDGLSVLGLNNAENNLDKAAQERQAQIDAIRSGNDPLKTSLDELNATIQERLQNVGTITTTDSGESSKSFGEAVPEFSKFLSEQANQTALKLKEMTDSFQSVTSNFGIGTLSIRRDFDDLSQSMTQVSEVINQFNNGTVANNAAIAAQITALDATLTKQIEELRDSLSKKAQEIRNINFNTDGTPIAPPTGG